MIAEALRRPLFYCLFLVSSGLCWLELGHTPTMVALACVFTFGLSLATTVDFKYMILPDSVTLPLLATGLFAPQLLFGQGWFITWLGAAVGFGFFVGLSWGFYKLRGYPGLGFGDVKFLAMLGAWVSVINIPLILLIAAFSALPMFMAHKLIFKPNEPTPLPFGPFLALGGFISFLYADVIWSFIIHLRLYVLGG